MERHVSVEQDRPVKGRIEPKRNFPFDFNPKFQEISGNFGLMESPNGSHLTLFLSTLNSCFQCQSVASLILKLYSGAPNDQFVGKCIMIPQLMKINVIKAFSGVFQCCLENIICSFFPARHTRNFPAS